MNDDTARAPAVNKRRQRRGLGARLAVVGLLATIGVLVAACGGGSNDPGATSAGSSATTTTTAVAPSGSSGSSGSDSSGESSQSQQLQFAHCMRSQGVPNFPDPTAGGGLLKAISAVGINTRSASYQAALQACKKYTPAENMTPAQSAGENAMGLLFSQCMRSHGVPNYPDPSTGPAGEQVMDLRGLGLDFNSPTFQAANAACQKIVPGSK